MLSTLVLLSVRGRSVNLLKIPINIPLIQSCGFYLVSCLWGQELAIVKSCLGYLCGYQELSRAENIYLGKLWPSVWAIDLMLLPMVKMRDILMLLLANQIYLIVCLYSYWAVELYPRTEVLILQTTSCVWNNVSSRYRIILRNTARSDWCSDTHISVCEFFTWNQHQRLSPGLAGYVGRKEKSVLCFCVTYQPLNFWGQRNLLLWLGYFRVGFTELFVFSCSWSKDTEQHSLLVVIQYSIYVSV